MHYYNVREQKKTRRKFLRSLLQEFHQKSGQNLDDKRGKMLGSSRDQLVVVSLLLQLQKNTCVHKFILFALQKKNSSASESRVQVPIHRCPPPPAG